MISVIVPIYKVERYLPKCIESILAQTYRDIEVILVDDGSPDNCPRICDDYAKIDGRIIVIHQENAGVSAARNAGLDRAKGEYIGFVDPDDWIAPDMYADMISAIEREHAELAICGYDYYDENGRVDATRKYPERDDETISQHELMSRFSDMPPTVRHTTWNKVFISSLLGKLKYNDHLHSSEDVQFLNLYSKQVKKAVIIHKPYYKNLVRSGSATHGGLSVSDLADSFKAHNEMYETIVARYPDLRDHSLAFLMDVYVLKYNQAKNRINDLAEEEKAAAELRLKEMKKSIKGRAFQALRDREIYWKTRIMYLFIS